MWMLSANRRLNDCKVTDGVRNGVRCDYHDMMHYSIMVPEGTYHERFFYVISITTCIQLA